MIQIVQDRGDISRLHLHQAVLRNFQAQGIIVFDGRDILPWDDVCFPTFLEEFGNRFGKVLKPKPAQQTSSAHIHASEIEAIVLPCDLQVVHTNQAFAFGVNDLLVKRALFQVKLMTDRLEKVQFGNIHIQSDTRPERGDILGVDQFGLR